MMLPMFFGHLSSEKSISILAWSNSLDLKCVGDFEKKTGIKVYMSYFENNEELFVKLRAGKGQGYDLIMPSDYVMSMLIKDDLVKKIDKTRLNFWKNLYPALLGHEFDPHNDYSVPFAWGMYGITVDTRYFGTNPIPNSWALLFDKHIAPTRVGMNDDAREVMNIAALYLFGNDYDKVTPNKVEAIKKLLLTQKQWVTMYTDMRADYLLTSQTTPVVIALTTQVAHLLNEHDYYKFIVPKEGTFMIIDILAIPTVSQKDDFVYSFLNYLYTHSTMSRCADQFGFLSALQGITPTYNFPYAEPVRDMFRSVHLFRGIFSENILNAVWIALKSK
jgi:spermidine/putrescine transport system substrate-binding protein